MSCCCTYDADPPSFWDESWPRARKEHGCSECLRAIEPGERYQLVTGCWDGMISRYKTCQDCERKREAYKARNDGCAPCLGDLERCLINEWEERKPKTLAAALGGYARWWGLED